MNKISTDITGEFEVEKLRKNKRVVVFLICMMIATSLWFLNALSKDYITTISYPVKFINPPEKQFLGGNVASHLELRVSGKGFSLLQYKTLSFSPIILDVAEITKNLEPISGTFRVISRNLLGTVSEQISSDLVLAEIKPELLEIVLDSLTSKTVPVKLDLTVNFVPQMHLKMPVITKPDVVTITGPAILLSKIDSLKTKVNIVNKLDASIEQEIILIQPEKTTIVPEKIQLIIEVEKYTEKELKIPVEIRNKPEKTNIKLFPSEVKVLFSVGLSRFEQIKASDFGAEVDCDSINADVNNLNITLFKRPDFIQGVRLNPDKVEFLIETR